jgi:hypothetical protein
MVHGLWFMVYGLWFMVYGLWFMVYDFMVPNVGVLYVMSHIQCWLW